jgi:hypothetical protein
MRRVLYFALGLSLAVLACSLVSCSHTQPAPNVQSCPAACANLNRLGCPEASSVDACTTMCTKTQDAGITDLKPAQLAAAQTVADVQAVGTVACDVDPGAATSATCTTACAKVKQWCPVEGPGCLAKCTQVAAKGLTDLKLACLSAAKSKAQLQACGTVACK